MQDAKRLLGVGDEQPLGDFQNEAVRLQTRFGENPHDHLGEIGQRELDRRKVDRHPEIARPLHSLDASLAQRPLAQRQDQAAVFGDGNKHRRRNHAHGWMVPSRQGFEAGNGVAAQIDDRLIFEVQPMLLDRLAQIRFDLPPVVELLVHGVLVEAIRAAPGGLDRVER